MKQFVLILTLGGLLGSLSACAPRVADIQYVTLTPTIYAAKTPVTIGQKATIQGRYLGGLSSGILIIGADEYGNNGLVVPNENIVSWTAQKIEFIVPATMNRGGSWVFVKVGDILSTGLLFNTTSAN